MNFLQSVAEAYASRGDDMSHYCFLFPNKRSGRFFLKYLSASIGTERPRLAPSVMSMTDVALTLSQRVPDSRIDMIFRLYNIYRTLMGKALTFETDDDLLDFDRFIAWGDTLISDFSEADKYDADAEKLFRNVTDLRSIASNYLTDEQIEVIERYFGYTPSSGDVDRFWKSLQDVKEDSAIRSRFVALWQMLSELYDRFNESLEADGLCTPGGGFRLALDAVRELGREAFPWKRLVVVGFSDLSTAELKIFESIRDMRCDDGHAFGEFFWDATGPVLSNKDSGPGRSMERLIALFPQPEWALPFIEKAQRNAMPPIVIEASPSNSMQAKLAGNEIARLWATEEGREAIEKAEVAVVLPDESLLMPLLYSLPNDMGNVNLTMGYSMRYTAVASFVRHLRLLLQRQRSAHGVTGFFHEDMIAILGHPITHILAEPGAPGNIATHIHEHHTYVVTPELLAKYSPRLARMLVPASRLDTPEQSIQMLDSLLEEVQVSLGRDENASTLSRDIENAQVEAYRNSLRVVTQCVKKYKVSMRFDSVFRLVDRLVQGEKITFEGEPLQGLQVMGMLETRALDFDQLFMLSLNDKTMPSASRRRSFIPDSVRHGYGLPISSHGERLYSYYFYRLLSRANNVYLYYDARAGEGMRSGGKSRFLMQLELLYGTTDVTPRSRQFEISSSESAASPVKKTPEVMALLNQFKEKDKEKGRNLSASSLQKYPKCQVMFYYETVRGISDDPVHSDYIDAITLGNIVHNSLLLLYFPPNRRKKYISPSEGITLTEDYLQHLIDSPDRIEHVVRRSINKEHFGMKAENGDDLDRELPGAARLVADRILQLIKSVILYDKNLAPITLVGGELDGNMRWQYGTNPDESVNIRYALDRVDIANGNWRIIDYKTGNVGLKTDAISSIFALDNVSHPEDSKNIFQLMFYANVLMNRVEQEGDTLPPDVLTAIYDVQRIAMGNSQSHIQIKNGRLYMDEPFIANLNNEFTDNLNSMLKDIFDPTKDFMPTTNEEICKWCRLKALCGKEN